MRTTAPYRELKGRVRRNGGDLAASPHFEVEPTLVVAHCSDARDLSWSIQRVEDRHKRQTYPGEPSPCECARRRRAS